VGTTEQKNKNGFLPSPKGEMIGAFALTEPGAAVPFKSLVTEFTQTLKVTLLF